MGCLDSPHVLPLAGVNPFGKFGDETSVTTSFEVYYNSVLNVTIVQLRAMLLERKAAIFATDLVDWISSVEFSQVLLLTGADASRRLVFDGLPLRFVASLNATPEISDRVAMMQVRELEEIQDEVLESLGKMERPFIPGGGVSTKLFREFQKSSAIPLVVLIWFAAEGGLYLGLPSSRSLSLTRALPRQLGRCNRIRPKYQPRSRAPKPSKGVRFVAFLSALHRFKLHISNIQSLL